MTFEILKKQQAKNYYNIEPISAVMHSNIGIFDLSYDLDAQKLITDINEFRLANPKSMHEYAKNETHVSAWHSHYETYEVTDILNGLIIAKTEKIKKFIGRPCSPTVRDMWINMYEKDDFASRHYHSPYYISTVYYPHVDGKTTPLIFDNNDQNNFREVKIFPKSGMLIVFNSFLYHRVPKCEEEKTRISIAANFHPNLWRRENFY